MNPRRPIVNRVGTVALKGLAAKRGKRLTGNPSLAASCASEQPCGAWPSG